MANTPPVITGTATLGQQLTITDGTWTQTPTVFTRQWMRCDAAGANAVVIPSATGNTYVLVSADVGATLRCWTTAFNAFGASAAVLSAQTGVVSSAAAAVPANVQVPILSGSAVQGSMLASSSGSWTNSPTSYAYTWKSCTPVALPLGETSVLTSAFSGNNNRLVAQSAVLAATATIQSLAIYLESPQGKVRLGIYNDVGGRPSALKATTAEFTPVVGWNIINVVTPVSLTAGTYWLASFASLDMGYRKATNTSSTRQLATLTYGALPATYPATSTADPAHMSLYATLAGNEVCTTIPSTTGGSYTLTAAEVGKTIRCSVVASNVTGASVAAAESVPSAIVITPVPAPPPPPSGYTYRMATFNTSTDIIKGCTNRFQPIQSWWVPGTATGTPWANNGGIFEISTPYGPGFKMCITPDMKYPAANPDSQECNFNAYPAEIGAALGRTHVWEWTEFWPSGSENPAGQLTDGTWVAGEGVNFAMSSPFGNTVGHHLFMDYSAGHGGIGWRFGRQVFTGANLWTWTQYPSPFLADTYYSHKWEAKWSAGSDGYFRVTTTKAGGLPLTWVNFSGPTLPSGWNIWKYMFTYRVQGTLNRHQTKHLINMRVTIT